MLFSPSYIQLGCQNENDVAQKANFLLSKQHSGFSSDLSYVIAEEETAEVG